MSKSQLRRREFIQKVRATLGATLAARGIHSRAQQLATTSRPAARSEAALMSCGWFVRNNPLWVEKVSHPQDDITFVLTRRRSR